MSILGNLLWILLGGILIFLEYVIGGLLLCLTIIGIPFGIQCFKLAFFALMPFGRSVSITESASSCLSVWMNIFWICIGGIWIALTHYILGWLLFITIIGIPFAQQHFKLAQLALAPFGRILR